MPAAADLEDVVPSRQPLRQHDGVHRGQRAGGREADFGVTAAEPVDEGLGELDLVAGFESRVQGAALEAGRHPTPDEPRIVTKDIGVVPLPIIDIRVAVDVPDPGAFRRSGEEGMRTPQPDGVTAAGDHDLPGPLEDGPAADRSLFILPDQVAAELVESCHGTSFLAPI